MSMTDSFWVERPGMPDTLVNRIAISVMRIVPEKSPKTLDELARMVAIEALKAMKNPPPSIKARGAKAIFNNQDLAHDAWDQMIDQAIKEGGG